jgi:hypothetical protein
MVTNWNLQSSMNMLNDFCADIQNFSYTKLAALKIKGLTLNVNASVRELSMQVSTEEDYQTVQWHLTPNKRMYELLGLHFNKVHIYFGAPDDPIEHGIYLDTVSLGRARNQLELRDANSLGARFRRVVNVALQGHIGVLRLRDDSEIEQLKALWERGRVAQLIEKYGIIPFDDDCGELVKLWKPRRFNEGELPVIIID